MNRFSVRRQKEEEQQNRQKREIAELLEGVGVKVVEPEKFELEDLQEMHDSHYRIVQMQKPRRGRYLTYKEMAMLAEINEKTLGNRLRAGLTLFEALTRSTASVVHYVEPQRSKREQQERKRRRIELLNQINILEAKNGNVKEIRRLERELANV